ncbi:hypothetical protein FQR65_LT00686 [Abscondita terminalis]|nr:hypothetical protein FQR65_LT00686 [Abscondita terminalis]
MAKEIKGVMWKPADYEGSILNKDLDGLIGFEECVDYDLTRISPEKSNKTKLKESNVDAPSAKKKKKEKITIKANKTILTKNERKNNLKVNKINSEVNVTLSKEGSTDNDITTEDIDINKFLEWDSFGLPQSILKAVVEQGFEKPTKIQALTLPSAIFGRRDILGAAETGSGKTLAFGLPILTGILKIKEKCNSTIEKQREDDNSKCNDKDDIVSKPLYALILTPTRELAVQVKNHLVAAAKYTDIHVAVVLGGMAAVKQERILSKGPEIVVATPGRLWELIQEGNSHLSQVDSIKFLAIDETDRMLEKGHFRELHELLERINFEETNRRNRQNFVFSATLTLTHELPKYLAIKKRMKLKSVKKILNMTPEQKLQKIIEILGVTAPKIVDVTQKNCTAESLSECRITCNIDEKDFYVYYFLQKHPGRTLIFCNSIGCVKRLTTLLGLLGCNPLALHASMQQRQRLKNLERFRDNEFGILIATDVAARGLDIPSVQHVLHYQTPRTSESYVHRSGRTARATREGITVLLVEPSELQNYVKLCRTLKKPEDLPIFPIQNNLLSSVKQRVNLARQLDKLELVVRKSKSESGWLQKAAEEMDILIEDNDASQHERKEAFKCKKAAEIKRKELAKLLVKPLFPKGFTGKYPLVDQAINSLLLPSAPKPETAIESLKNSLDNSQHLRKKAKWLFKGKGSTNIHVNIQQKINVLRKKQNKKIKK